MSFESEKLELPKAIRIRGAAEQWLGNYCLFSLIMFTLKFFFQKFDPLILKLIKNKYILPKNIFFVSNQIKDNK